MSVSSNISCFLETSAFIFEEMKFTRNDGLSMFPIANCASEGIFGLSRIMSRARSFMVLSMISSSLLPFLIGISLKTETFARIYGSVCRA